MNILKRTLIKFRRWITTESLSKRDSADAAAEGIKDFILNHHTVEEQTLIAINLTTKLINYRKNRIEKLEKETYLLKKETEKLEELITIQEPNIQFIHSPRPC
jgi:hypothetical protein